MLSWMISLCVTTLAQKLSLAYVNTTLKVFIGMGNVDLIEKCRLKISEGSLMSTVPPNGDERNALDAALS